MLRRLAFFLALLAAPTLTLHAQDVELTTDVLDRFVTAYDREREDIAALDAKLAEIDAKIQKFRECKTAFEVAGSASRSRLGGLAARAGIRARCGANNEAEIEKEKKVLLAKASVDAASASGFSVPEFSRLKTRLERIYSYGDRAGLKDRELAAIDARAERFGSIYGGDAGLKAVADAIAAAGGQMGSAGGGRVMPGQWTADLSWLYVSQLFGMMYSTGAAVFDGAYEPGQWTRWSLRGASADEHATVERAFLARAEDGSEWWRFKTISRWENDGKPAADTITLEALFKPLGDGAQQLVRMRGKMPGDTEANELMVPEHMTHVSTLGMFGTRPTKESVEGATVGTESVTTPAGALTARLVRFGGGGSRQEWWLTDAVPGGWVRYRASGSDPDESFVMELVAHGSGAKSELGVK